MDGASGIEKGSEVMDGVKESGQLSDMRNHIKAIEKLDSEEIQASYLLMLIKAVESGLRVESERTKITAVRFYDQSDRYVYSFIVNKSDMLFYLRKPILDVSPDLKETSSEMFGETYVNGAGEVTIRIAGFETAKQICAWLFSGEA